MFPKPMLSHAIKIFEITHVQNFSGFSPFSSSFTVKNGEWIEGFLGGVPRFTPHACEVGIQQSVKSTGSITPADAAR